ncbi:MAG: hypothetical protein ACOX9C_04175 [Kiritimatiellia bacterium]
MKKGIQKSRTLWLNFPTIKEGFRRGQNLEERLDIGEVLDRLDESQAKEQRHKSPHAAFARGYEDGVKDYYKRKK